MLLQLIQIEVNEDGQRYPAPDDPQQAVPQGVYLIRREI
jgi:hypothetical protein